jgi:hypothetical protein
MLCTLSMVLYTMVYPSTLMAVCVYKCPEPIPATQPYSNRLAIPYGDICPSTKVIKVNGNA